MIFTAHKPVSLPGPEGWVLGVASSPSSPLMPQGGGVWPRQEMDAYGVEAFLMVSARSPSKTQLLWFRHGSSQRGKAAAAPRDACCPPLGPQTAPPAAVPGAVVPDSCPLAWVGFSGLLFVSEYRVLKSHLALHTAAFSRAIKNKRKKKNHTVARDELPEAILEAREGFTPEMPQ